MLYFSPYLDFDHIQSHSVSFCLLSREKRTYSYTIPQIQRERDMSGGVGPTGYDISLPKEQELNYKEEQDQQFKNLQNKTSTPRKAGFLSFSQLNSLAVIIVLSASGMVSPEDFVFVLFSLIYMYFISKVAFPSLHQSKETSIFNPQGKLLRLYLFIGTIIGLYTPIAYILEGIFEGDKEGIKAATPHVFLLASQFFMEGVTLSDRFSAPIRAFVPVFHNSRRIFTIVDWVKSEMYKIDVEEHSGSPWRANVGRALAAANMAFWCFNLFGFLLRCIFQKFLRCIIQGTNRKTNVGS